MTSEIELGIIGDFLSDGANLERLRKFVADYNLKAEHFQDNYARAAFEALAKEESNDTEILRDLVMRKIDPEFVEKALGHATTDPMMIDRRISDLAESGRKRIVDDFVDKAKALKASTPRAEDYLALIEKGLERAGKSIRSGKATDATGIINFGEFGAPTPDEENPDALFGHGWMRKGQANVLVSTSGTGKSVVSIQLAYAWALGREAFGLKPLRPLKIGFLETEDDLEEMREFRANMHRGYKEVYGWTDLDFAAAEKNLAIPNDFKAETGKDFVEFLRRWQLKHHFDLIVINPLQGVCGCDIANNSELREFLREGLDPVIRDEKTKCALLIVHHTNKPPTNNDRSTFGSDRYAEYLGAGGAELTNWIRSMLVIMRVKDKKGVFDLIAAKRGNRLGWPVIDDKSTKPHRYIAHSEGMIFWREVEPPEGSGEKSTTITVEDAARQLAENLKIVPRSLTEARAYAEKTHGRSKGEKVYTAVLESADEYGLEIVKTGYGNEKIIRAKSI